MEEITSLMNLQRTCKLEVAYSFLHEKTEFLCSCTRVRERNQGIDIETRPQNH